MKKFWRAPVQMLLLVILAFGMLGVTWTMEQGQKQNRTFGLVCMTMNNEFYEVIRSELGAVLQTRNDRLITLDPQLNLNKQAEQIYWLIDQKVDGIFINPMDSKAISEPVQKAWEKGIPVIILDAPLSEKTMAVSTIASDNWQAGVLCARDLLRKMDNARIGVLSHSQVESAKERIEGFTRTIEQAAAQRPNPDSIRIVASQECQGQLELAMPAAEQMLSEHPEINVIMALNDPSAMGALAALESLGRTDVRVYGVDGTPDVKNQLQSNPCMIATAAQSPINIGRTAAATMYAWLETGTCRKEQVLGVYLIDKDNIQEYSVSRWQ